MEQDNNIITASIEAESVSAHTKEKKVSGIKKRFGKKNRKSATQINESNNGVNQIDGTYEAAGEGDVTTDASASVDTKKSFRKKSSKAKKAFNIYRDNTGDGSNNTAKQGESFMRGIKTKLIITSLLPTVVGVIIVLIVAVINITQGMNEQAVNGLTLLGESTKASYENTYMGDWRVDNNGNLFKGDTNLSQKQDGIDKYITDNDADLAVFIGVDCKLTSLKDSNNKRMLSLKADEKIWENVKSGTIYTTSHVDIDGTEYTGVYIPLKNFSGSVVGMMFSGQPRTDITSFIMNKIIALIVISLVVFIVVIVGAFSVSSRIANALISVNKVFISLADGDLTGEVNPALLARKDEIGQMAKSVQVLIDKLHTIVTDLQSTAAALHSAGDSMTNTAGQSSKATEEISSAVEDISKGAIAQAEDIQNASAQIANMGELISGIVEKVANLTQAADTMSKAGDTIFFIADKEDKAAFFAGQIRNELGARLDLIEKNAYRFCYVNDFPMFERDPETKKIGFTHNPFSMPQGGLEALNTMDPLDILAYQYDIVCNGVELSSGAVRNHDMQIMVKAFEIAGYDEEVLKAKFGALYNAFQFGAPPHAGMAPGVDRMIMLLRNEENIREVIPFPMSGTAQDLMCGAPNEVTEQQLREVHIKVRD